MEQEPAPAQQPPTGDDPTEAITQQASSQPLMPEARPPSQPIMPPAPTPSQPLPAYQPLPQWAPSAPQPSQALPTQWPPSGYQPTQPPPPQWQLPQPPRSKWKTIGIISLILNGLLIIAVIVSLGSAKGPANSTATGGNTPTSSGGSNTPTVPTAATGQHYQVGQTVTVGDAWQVTINSATTSQGSGDDPPPKAGNVYLIIEATLKNLQSKAAPLSTLIDFELHDAQGNHYTESFLFSLNGPDGTVEAGGLAHGKWGYEVPASVHSFTLLFSKDFGQTVTIWDINV